MEKLQLDRENTGNLKIQFEWVPCKLYLLSFGLCFPDGGRVNRRLVPDEGRPRPGPDAPHLLGPTGDRRQDLCQWG